MKRQLSILIIIALPAILLSQTVSETIADADKLFLEKSYMQSLKMLRKAEKQIGDIYLEELIAELLPSKIEEYAEADVKAAVETSSISGSTIQINQRYSKKNNADSEENAKISESSTTISISNSSDKAFQITESYNMNSNNETIDPLIPSPVKFKDYRAVIQYEEEMKQGTFMAIVGAATIEVMGQNIQSKDELLTIANKIDLEKIIKTFGK